MTKLNKCISCGEIFPETKQGLSDLTFHVLLNCNGELD